MEEDSDEDIEIIEHIKPSSNRKWNVPNPWITKGTEKDILDYVRKKVQMDDSLAFDKSHLSAKSPHSQNLFGHEISSNEPEASMCTPHKSSENTPSSTLAMTPEQIQELTENCLDSDNEPFEDINPEESDTMLLTQIPDGAEKCPSALSKIVSPSQKNSTTCVEAGTSAHDSFEIFSKGARNLSKSPSTKRRRLTKNSPIRFLPRVVNSSKKSPRSSPIGSPKKFQMKSPLRMSGPASPKKTGVRRILDMSSGDNASDIELPYYFEAFCSIVKKIQTCSSFHHLFLDRELEKIAQVDSSKTELKLYVRLMNRKDKWNRVQSIRYDDIATDLNPLFNKLEEEQFIVCDLSEAKLDELLNLLNTAEVKSICSKFRVNTGSKNDMVKALLSMHRTQPTFGTSPLRKILVESLGRCVRLTQEWRVVFRRCVVLFSMFHSNEELDKLSQEQALLLLQVKLKKMVFPISELQVKQHPEIFINRDQFIRYEEARDIIQKYQTYSSEKNGDALEELTKKSLLQFSTLLELKNETRHVLSLPTFLQKFTAGSLYAYVLSLCADEMKKLKKLELALCVLRTLLGQNVYRKSNRGVWTLQLCSLLHVNLKDMNMAAVECFKGLSDKSLGVVQRMHIQKRAEKVCKSLKGNSQNMICKKLQEAMDTYDNKTVNVQISARPFSEIMPGVRRTYIRETDNGKEFLSVEEFVKAHYRSQGFVYGVHDEGTTIASLCFLLLWDIIYDETVPFTFISPFQDKPLDWGSEQFYSVRKASIENRFVDLLSKSEEVVALELIESYNNHAGINSVVTWSMLENLHILVLLECLTIPVFIAICRRLIQDLRSHRSGFPDLMMWNPDEKKCLFIEVKSPNDTLSTIQFMWLDFLNQNGATAFIANVKDTGSKSCAT